MSATHTPGPWYAIEYAGMWGIQSVDEYSQDNNLLDMENDDRAEANAKLIAAAPDLLEALNLCRIALYNTGLYNFSEQLAYSEANKAIKKATE